MEFDIENKNYFCISDFGAVGDSKTKDTKAIQAAVDACSKSGGGKVYVAPGNYLSGTIILKDNVCLHLEAGAIITGSPDFADYIPDPYCHTSTKGALFFGKNIKNVTIEGRGCIDGNGSAFWESEYCNKTALKPKLNRPHALFFITESENILIRDITIKNSPCYTVWIFGCEKVNISAIMIDNPLNGPNTDAIDIDCSSNVFISNCHISTGDDCIALKSDAKKLGKNKSCENIVVSNCILRSNTCAIRVGYEGDETIKNCVFSNLVIYDTSKGIDIISILPDMKIPFTEISQGARISNITFSDIVMQNVEHAIYIWQGDEIGGNFQGKIENININNLTAESKFASFIGSVTNKPIKELALNNLKINIEGCLDKTNYKIPGVWSTPEIPWGFYIRNVENVLLNSVHVTFAGASGPWESLVKLESCKDIELNSLKTKSDILPELAPVILFSCNKAVIINSSCSSKSELLFLIQGNETRSIRFMYNILFEVEKLFKLEKGVTKNEIQALE